MALLRYLLRRLVTMVLTLAAISALVFFIIKLPPGDYLTNQIAELAAEGISRASPRRSSCATNSGSICRSGSNISSGWG